MRITSHSFFPNGMIPKKYTCQGNNVSPSIEIIDAPAATKSFAVIVHDHDVPGGDFVHWLLWNIDPKILNIREATTPVGAVEGTNDAELCGWTGPCPPSGTHRYEFHVYALNSMIGLPMVSTKNELRNEIKEKILEEASIVGLYNKKEHE